jgi:multicomponent Na+:H+ antiporter subunit B
MGLPGFGDATSPANAHVGRIYLEQTSHDIGVPNMVTAVLSSYRGFDTLGETVVIFAAGVGVALLLGFGPRSQVAPPPQDLGDDHVVLRVAAKLLIPLIVLYAFYVQFHGDIGAGGGFQAGVILAVAVILHALVFGLQGTMAAVPAKAMRAVAALGVMLYAGVGVVCLLNGGGFLDYDYLFSPRVEAMIPANLLGDPDHEHHWGQHFGIFFIELGVLLTVASTMVTIYYGFAGRAVDREAKR